MARQLHENAPHWSIITDRHVLAYQSHSNTDERAYFLLLQRLIYAHQSHGKWGYALLRRWTIIHCANLFTVNRPFYRDTVINFRALVYEIYWVVR
jgi:hypothetical protein